MLLAGMGCVRERARIQHLRQRDGLPSTRDWVERTLGIYRRAVLSRSHHAHLPEYRREFILSYCDFKRWLSRARGRP
ncbi:MAG TPA: hypothetical protein VK972_09960 [Wenzhouxiangella sp.]|nr:hypothetical protein [Wenzhouxiangella sp.]